MDNRLFSLRGILAAVAGAPGAAPKMTYRSGPHGEKISLLGYGGMRLPTIDGGHANVFADNASDAAIDQAAVNRHVDYALANGVNFFDTSPCYCRGESEAVLGRALSRYPRERYYLSTKLSNFAKSEWSFEKCKAMFFRSLKLLQTDYVDFYLLHNVGNNDFDTFRKRYVDNGVIPWLFEQKARGLIRNLGWSYHGDRRAMDWLLEKHDAGEYRWDFALIQLNYLDWRHAREMNARNLDAEYLYGELARRKLKVMVMEPLRGGELARLDASSRRELIALRPEATPANWAFRFAGTPPEVMTVLSGMTRFEHLEENVRTFSPHEPISEREAVALEKVAAMRFAAGLVPCTRCQYCMPCPYGLDIPALLAFRNEWLARARSLSAREVIRAYERAIPVELRRAEHCTGCGRCLGACPQQIDIPKTLAAIDQAIEALKDEEARR